VLDVKEVYDVKMFCLFYSVIKMICVIEVCVQGVTFPEGEQQIISIAEDN
jgi:hypothetical protein